MTLIDKVTLDESRHEASIRCNGTSHRITAYDCNRLSLEDGLEVNEELLDEILQSETRLSCIQKAFSYLSYGDQSKKRLYEKLHRTFPSTLCAEVVALMEERGYIDDLRLAERYADNYYSIRSYGPLRIKQELRGKGFTYDTIETVLEPYETLDHSDKIQMLLSQKFLHVRADDYSARKKAVAWLNRQGYSWSDMSETLNSFFQDDD